MTETGWAVDTDGLRSYLAAERGIEVVGTAVLNDGLNLNVALSTADEERAYVLRRPNKLRHTSYIIDLGREYEVLRRLRETAVPAPEPVLFCRDESVIGDRFLVTTHLDGEAIPLGAALPERFQDPASRKLVADHLVDTLAAIHSVDVDRFADVCERLTPREQVERAADRLDAATSATGHEVPRLRAVATWLRRNAPSPPATTLVHGDYRPGNVLFAGADRPELVGVLDWETAMLGDPLTELGYLLLRWRDDDDPTPSLDAIDARDGHEAAFERLRDANENGLAPFTARAGSPSRQELVVRYEERTGRSFENDRFYRALAAFLLATVWEDLHRHRLAAGAESQWQPHVEYMALLADGIVDGEF